MLATTARQYYEGQQQPEAEASEPEATTPRVLLMLAAILERQVARNELILVERSTNSLNEVINLKVFNGVRAPNISIAKYLDRLYKYTKCSPSCFVVGYVYIDRLIHRHPELLLISINVHRLVLTSVMIACKMLDDVQYNNAFYAKVGGISNTELNRLELELLFLLDFEVVVSSPVFQSYCWYLEKEDRRINATLRIDQPLAFDIKDDLNSI